ncbi:MAG: NUDIX hydrolase [Deltaproteobacteria bacterium]|nr:NUDIX hydrolase [Deltaproteobacteria bacterium]
MARSPKRRPDHGSAGLLIVSGHRVLVLERSPGSRNGGTWGLPGGRVDEGEHALRAAHRETEEELGSVPPVHLLGCLSVRRRRRERYRIFVGRTPRQHREAWRPELNEEHVRWRWVSLAWLQARRDRLHPVLRLVADRPLAFDALREAVRADEPLPDSVPRRRDPTIKLVGPAALRAS